MKQSDFTILRDPATKASLEHKVDEKQLQGSASFPISHGIPCFAATENFEDHWEDNATADVPDVKLDVAINFLKPVEDKISSAQAVLDVGCGDGMHLITLADHNIYKSRSLDLVGIDLSFHALKLCEQRLQNDALLVQGDALKLPFDNAAFDTVFSYGVLGYTPDPEGGFEEMVRVCKPGGHIGLWLYPKKTGLGGALFGMVRWWCRNTGRLGTSLMANAIVPFLWFLPTTSKVTLANSSWGQCREVVMVNIAPTNLFFPTPEEILAWFEKRNIEVISNDPKEPIAIWGIKS